MQQFNNTGLPFDPIAIGVLPAFVPYLHTAIGLLKEEIAGKANTNKARGIIYNQMCGQTELNPNFHRLLVTVSEYAMMLIDYQRQDPGTAIRTAVSQTLAMKVGVWYLSNQHEITSKEMWDSIQQAAAMANQTNIQIEDYVNRVRQANTWQQPQQQNTWQQPQQFNTTYTTNMNTGWTSPMAGGAMNNLPTAGRMDVHVTAPVESFGNQHVSNHTTLRRGEFQPVVVDYNATSAGMDTETRVTIKRGSVRTLQARGELESLSAAPAVVHSGVSANPALNQAMGVTPTQQWRDNVLVPEVVVSAPALTNVKTKRTFTIDRPYAVVYDESENFVWIDNVDGVLQERIGNVELEEVDLDYADHEMNPDNAAAIKATVKSQKKERVISLLGKITTVAQPDLPDADVIINVPFLLPGEIHARDVDDALSAAIDVIAELEEVPETHEFYFTNNTPLVIDNEFLLAGLTQLSKAKTANDLLNALAELADILPGKWYQQLDERLAQMVTDQLRHRLGIDWKIKSFVNSYADIRTELANDFGASVAELYVENEIDLVQCFVGGMRFSKRKRDAEFADTLRFNWTDYVLVLPLSYKELSLACNEDSGAIIQTNTPELYEALHQLIERSDAKTPSVWTRTIVTSDSRMFRVHQGYFNPEFIVLEFYRKPV